MKKTKKVEVELKGKKYDIFLSLGVFKEPNIVYPIRKDPDNPKSPINWKNLLIGGSWGKIITIIFVIIMLLLLITLYRTDIESVKQAACEHPQEVCDNYFTLKDGAYKLNVSYGKEQDFREVSTTIQPS